jgi:hypothetical protein
MTGKVGDSQDRLTSTLGRDSVAANLLPGSDRGLARETLYHLAYVVAAYGTGEAGVLAEGMARAARFLEGGTVDAQPRPTNP